MEKDKLGKDPGDINEQTSGDARGTTCESKNSGNAGNTDNAAEVNTPARANDSAAEKEGNDKADAESDSNSDNNSDINSEIESLRAELEEKTKTCNEYFEKLQRIAAEFDNYKKRTQKEKECLYSDAVADVVAEFLPVLDNIERAVEACSQDADENSIKEGVEMILRQFRDTFKKIGVEEIDCLDKEFDPQYHNAVLHEVDETKGQGIVVEELRKGYIYKDRVIRHSMVKVVN